MKQAVKLREKLVNKLASLFQLNQPDLDFGFYRIMHAKAAEVQQFIDKDLLTIITDAFGQADNNQVAAARDRYETAIQQAKEFELPNPENTKPVQEAKAAYDAARESGSNEAQVYDHLYRFFERYYDSGDFISRRHYTRETAGSAAPYAIPYNGEEVKLHWANADQYYIKSTEYFSNFSFDLRQAKEVREQEGLDFGSSERPLKVHFQIVDASEGEHGNIKASDNQKRGFILHAAQPVALNEANELVVNFEYRVLSSQDALTHNQETQVKKEFGASRKGDLPNLYITSQILKSAKALKKLPADYLALLITPTPTNRIKQRPLLAKYINQYTSRNTMDYFIHKDLGGFLRRELDFYIKNEVMRLDDIENADVPAVESYLSKIKVLRQIAHQLIAFLAQLEDFQKKLWLKKKFVTETNYCITLDRVPEALYSEIADNKAQLSEWIHLFAIDEIKGDLTTPAFSNPLTLEFLQANQNLVLDTQFFDETFTAQLLASIDGFDEQCDGLLLHSENFQALQLLQERYREQVKCVYIDPPYNTEQDRQQGKFIYKDSYENSSWAAMMHDRMGSMRQLQHTESSFFVSLDENELHRMVHIIEDSDLKYHGLFTWRRTRTGGHLSRTLNQLSDYIIVATTANNPRLYGGQADEEESQPLTKSTNASKTLVFQPGTLKFIDFKEGEIKKGTSGTGNSPVVVDEAIKVVEHYNKNVVSLTGPFIWTQTKLDLELSTGAIVVIKRVNNLNPRFFRKPEGHKPFPSLSDGSFSVGTNEDGSAVIEDLLGTDVEVSYPKPVLLLERVIQAKSAFDKDCTVLDYFAGSGTTGHAAINLNQTDNGQRKYILIEMGEHFDTVLKPRLAKVAYATEWKNGKPLARDTGISHCFKYMRLESYEDTLNNLRLVSDPVRQRAIDANSQLKQDYMLNYMLDVETRGSQSLLNIDAFADPTSYTLEVKKPGTDESVERTVDLIETFNYLIGLRVEHMAAPQCFNASFSRVEDAHAPKGQTTRLVLDDHLQQDDNGPWWLRKVEGWVPNDPANPNNGLRDKVLIVWRKLTGDLEQDNVVLDEWFEANRINSRDFEYVTIYVNGSNNLSNLRKEEDLWKVRLIEEEFMQRMWDVGQDVLLKK